MSVWPLKFRAIGEDDILFADDAGGFFLSNEHFLQRYAGDRLSGQDQDFLKKSGHSFEEDHDLSWTSFAYRWVQRQSSPRRMGYVILVPTLRCNLTCDYCQVSRVGERAHGFDWSEETLGATLQFLDQFDTDIVKIEFQGGEPLLRIDLLERVRTFCRARFTSSQFIVCTNLQCLGEREWTFLGEPDTFVSTSLDGDGNTHERQRTHDSETTATFFNNLEKAVARLGAEHISALPTIDADNPPDFSALVDTFEHYGLRSLYLRPINHQGFARRRAPLSAERWNKLHGEFIDFLIERNHRSDYIVEEYYFSQCLRRLLRAGADDHVDLRNPSFFANDYLVIDHDGRFFPTDEARMITRIGRIDLSVGSVANGLDAAKIDGLNQAAFNNFDSECIHCPYQPFCGTDVIDDLSRYGRIDIPRRETWFCSRQTAIFDKVVEVISRRDDAARRSIAHWLGIAEWSDEMVSRYQ